MIHIVLDGHTFKLCAECEGRLRLIGNDYDRLKYTIAQMIKKVPLECLTGDLSEAAVAHATKIILEARDEWKQKLAAAEHEAAVKSDMEHEGFIANDLQQRIRTQIQNPNALAPDYATYSVRPEDKLALHSLGVSWNTDDEKALPQPAVPSEEEQCEISKASQRITSKLFEKS